MQVFLAVEYEFLYLKFIFIFRLPQSIFAELVICRCVLGEWYENGFLGDCGRTIKFCKNCILFGVVKMKGHALTNYVQYCQALLVPPK